MQSSILFLPEILFAINKGSLVKYFLFKMLASLVLMINNPCITMDLKKISSKRLISKRWCQINLRLLQDARSGDLEHLSCTVERLQKKRPSFRIDTIKKYPKRMNLLHYASAHGNLALVQYLVEKQNMDPSATTKQGYSALYVASSKGHKSVVRYFLKKCRMPWRTKTIETSPVSIAIQNNHQSVVRRLLKHEKCLICLEHINKTPIDQIIITNCCQQIMCARTYTQLITCPGCRKAL